MKRILKSWACLLACIACVGCGGDAPGLNQILQDVARQPDPLARYVSDHAEPVTQHLGVVFGDQLELVGINVPNEVRIGQPFEIEQVWHCLNLSDREWSFALLFDHANPRWRLNKGHRPPVPTSMWEKGDYVSWKVQIEFPADAPPGDYIVNLHPFFLVKEESKERFERLPVRAGEETRYGKLRLLPG